MKLLVDNLDGAGLRDYTAALDGEQSPLLRRRLNAPDELNFRLQVADPSLAIPRTSARVVLQRESGVALFTGYVTALPDYDYLGWGERGPVYRVSITAVGDELLLDRRPIPAGVPYTNTAAGDILKSITEALLPGSFDLSGVASLDVLPGFAPSRGARWSEIAAQLASLARANYRVTEGAITFQALGAQTHALAEGSALFTPSGVKFRTEPAAINDVTVIGPQAPAAYVREYFLADGAGTTLQPSQRAFVSATAVLLDEEYAGTSLEPVVWSAADPAGAISVIGSRLRLAGGTGSDGQTTVTLRRPLEIAGALTLTHGTVSFSGSSQGILGGLYDSAVSAATCFAGLSVATSSGQPVISAFVNGAVAGSPLTTVAGHSYELITRIDTPEIFRRRQPYHSSSHPSGSPRGGEIVTAKSRVVLEVRDIDPGNAASSAAAPLVLFDGVVASPAFALYSVVNAVNMQCSLASSRITRGPDVEVRAAAPGDPFTTLRVAPVADDGDCMLTGGPTLQFFSRHKPQFQERITLRYRGTARAVARLSDAASAIALSSPADDGVRSAVVDVLSPASRTLEDCENAARAVLDDATRPQRAGEYRVWSDFLPAADIVPGDALAVSVPSADANFTAIVREVEIAVVDVPNDRCRYQLRFADDAAQPLGVQYVSARGQETFDVAAQDVADSIPAPAALADAEVTSIAPGTATIDLGEAPPAGGGVEVRRADSGWGTDGASLIGRFTTQQFTVSRAAPLSDYFLRAYDAATPPRYSRYTTAFHIEYPA